MAIDRIDRTPVLAAGVVAAPASTSVPATELDAVPRATPLALVGAGERVEIDHAGTSPSAVVARPVQPIDEAELAERLSWRVPRLEFSGTALEQAVAMFNRHSRVQIVLDDAALGRLQVSGIVRADQADALVKLLVANYEVVAEPRGDDGILLRRSR